MDRIEKGGALRATRSGTKGNARFPNVAPKSNGPNWDRMFETAASSSPSSASSPESSRCLRQWFDGMGENFSPKLPGHDLIVEHREVGAPAVVEQFS